MFEMDTDALVGVEGAWPMLFRLMGVLGFFLAKRSPSGHYKTSWPRLLPMAAITSSLSWFFCTRCGFNGVVDYDSIVGVVLSNINLVLVVYAFAVAVYRRRETCCLFQALDGTLRPPKKWVSVAFALLFLLYTAFSLFSYSFVIDMATRSIGYLVSMTFFVTIIPMLLDLYVMALIDALHKAYKARVERIDKTLRQAPQGLPSIPLAFKILQVVVLHSPLV